MKRFRPLLGVLACVLVARGADEWFDRLAGALTFSVPDARVRARLSGTLDVEAYDFQRPAPGVIQSRDERLINPRLSVFLDAQLGPGAYFFAQARADRGFDPGDPGSRVRLDEYALRLTPWRGGHINVQIGRFATIVGNWAGRHGSWSDPFVSAPLPYEGLTGAWDTEPARTSLALLQWSHVRPGLPAVVTAVEKSRRLPIVWGPSYAPGVALSGGAGRWRFTAELKLGSLSSRPEAWQHGAEQREHPTVSTRMSYRPDPRWDFGVSASAGSYLRDLAARTLPVGYGRGDYRQLVLAQDMGFAWHHWQVWSEIYAARFEIPKVGNADTLAYYVEAKYKFTPQLFGAVRWNEQLFASIPDRAGFTRWGFNSWRIDLAPGYRFTPQTQMKLQYSLQPTEAGARKYSRTLALQLTMRF